MRDDESIGVGIATERKLRGLTQHQLAGRAHVSPSLLRAVEQANRAATASLVAAVARALHVERPTLVSRIAAPLRTRRRCTAGSPTSDTWPSWTRTVGAARGCRQRRTTPRALAWKLGHLDLAHGFGRLCRSTAAESDDPLAVEVGETTRGHDLLAAADFDLAAVVTDRAVDRLTELPVADGQPSVAGYMHLGAALVAARRGDDRTWQEHHAEAEEAAHRLGDDHRLAFGPTCGCPARL